MSPASGARTGKRDELIDATASLIAEKGVRGLRVEEVAERAGTAPSLIYYHFRDRNGLLQATMERANEGAPSWELRNPDDSRTAYARLVDVLQRELGPGAAIKQNVAVWNEVTASAVFDPELRKRIVGIANEWTNLVIAQIQAGILDGSIRAGVNPRQEAEIITALVDGLASQWLTGSVSRKLASELLTIAIRDRLAPSVER